MRNSYVQSAMTVCIFCLTTGSGRPDSRLTNTIANSTVFGNTNQYTPTIFQMWTSSYPCWTNFTLTTNYPPLAALFQGVPLPCYFQPSSGTDGEAVVLDSGLYDGKPRTYEFWQANWQNGWSTTWGGAADDDTFVQSPFGRAWPTPGGAKYGVQASGLAFVPGVITVADLQSGVISHAIHISVPTSCTTWVSPATRTDANASPTGTNDCYQYGTAYKLPQTFVIPNSWPNVDRMIAQAAKNYGLIITDANQYGVGFRFENYERQWAAWSPNGGVVNPYSDPTQTNLNLFQCPNPVTWSCYPDGNNLFLPLGQVYAPNSQSFWQALTQVNP